MAKSSNERQLEFLLSVVCDAVNSDVQLNPRLIRDIFDVIEGLMRGALNRNGNYDHSTLKAKCAYASANAKSLSLSLSRTNLTKATHREHAIPLKILIPMLYAMKPITPQALTEFLDQKLISVLITLDERRHLDSVELGLRTAMPLDWDGVSPFARFEKAQIVICVGDATSSAA